MVDDDEETRRVQEVGDDGFEAVEERKDGVEARRDELSLLRFLRVVSFLGEARLDLVVTKEQGKGVRGCMYLLRGREEERRTEEGERAWREGPLEGVDRLPPPSCEVNPFPVEDLGPEDLRKSELKRERGEEDDQRLREHAEERPGREERPQTNRSRRQVEERLILDMSSEYV